jgi:hypothetical protein
MLEWMRSKFRKPADEEAVAPMAPATPPPAPGPEDQLAAMLGDEVPTSPPGPEVLDVETRIRAEIEAGQLTIPPMPAGAARMLELVGRPTIDLNALVAAVHWEPGLVARILAVANSPAFRGTSQKVHDDLRGAMIALGLRMVGEIATGMATRSLFQVESRSAFELFPELWKAAHHETMVVAFGASALASGLNLPRPDRVFLRAVLAGAARTMALRALATQILAGRCKPPPPPEVIAAGVDAVHREVAAVAATRGALPAILALTDDRESELEFAAVDLVATLVELRRAPGRANAIARAKLHIAKLGIQPSRLRVILHDCDEAEQRVAVMLGEQA